MSVAAADSTLPEILAIATAISGAGDLRSLLHLILGKARALTAADAGSIFLVERAAPARFGMVGPRRLRAAWLRTGSGLRFPRTPASRPAGPMASSRRCSTSASPSVRSGLSAGVPSAARC